jgi:hypothetical protein
MNFTTGMASWARRGALAGAALVLAVALLVAGARAAEERAESGSIHHLRPVTAGDAVYGGHQIPYIFARTESPTAASATGGVILAFMPLADFERDADHRPVVEISDPGRGGDGVLVKIGEKPYRCRTAEELARKVQ